MSNEAYVRKLGIMYQRLLDLRSDDDYIISQPQLEKLMKIVEFFIDTANRLDGKVDPVTLAPREEHGGVTATFLVFDVCGDDVLKFCDVMRSCSAISIDSMEDGDICISCTVPNVFVHK